MPLDPDVEQFLSGPAANFGFPVDAATNQQAAAEYIARSRAALAVVGTGPKEPVAEVREETLPNGRTVRIYRDDLIDRNGSVVPAPIVLYFHGGGWVIGGLEMNDAFCRRLATLGGCVVVSVDYRLAPEHPYPAALDDCLDALAWVRAAAEEIGGDPANVSVSGTSAGGNLAAALALVVRDRGLEPLTAQVLLYPVIDAGMATPSYTDNAKGYLLSREQMAWYWQQYLGADFEGEAPAYAAPANEPDLAGLAPAVVATAEFDPLRDEAEIYAERLRTAGVPATTIRVDGQIHSFLGFLGAMPSADAAAERIIAAARALWARD